VEAPAGAGTMDDNVAGDSLRQRVRTNLGSRSEDCVFVNVWAPASNGPSSRPDESRNPRMTLAFVSSIAVVQIDRSSAECAGRYNAWASIATAASA
jgi:hypothetical protein